MQIRSGNFTQITSFFYRLLASRTDILGLCDRCMRYCMLRLGLGLELGLEPEVRAREIGVVDAALGQPR